MERALLQFVLRLWVDSNDPSAVCCPTFSLGVALAMNRGDCSLEDASFIQHVDSAGANRVLDEFDELTRLRCAAALEPKDLPMRTVGSSTGMYRVMIVPRASQYPVGK